MANTLGPKATQIFKFILAYRDANGKHDPSTRQIAEEVGLAQATVMQHINTLVRLGFIKKQGKPGLHSFRILNRKVPA